MSELSASDEGLNDPEFLKVKCGETFLIGKDKIAKVLTFIGGSRDTDAPTLFQTANVDTKIQEKYIGFMQRKKKASFLLEKADDYTKKTPQINTQFDCCSNRCPCWVHKSKAPIELFDWRSFL